MSKTLVNLGLKISVVVPLTAVNHANPLEAREVMKRA